MHAWCPLTCGVPAAWRQSEWTSSSSAPTRPQGGGASWVKSTLIAAILRAHHKSADTARVYPDRSPSTIVIDAMPAVRIRDVVQAVIVTINVIGDYRNNHCMNDSPFGMCAYPRHPDDTVPHNVAAVVDQRRLPTQAPQPPAAGSQQSHARIGENR
eukprot:7077847-Pyramimonas_sp.AAC.1